MLGDQTPRLPADYRRPNQRRPMAPSPHDGAGESTAHPRVPPLDPGTGRDGKMRWDEMIMYIPSRKMQQIATRDLDRGGRGGGFATDARQETRLAPLWVAEGRDLRRRGSCDARVTATEIFGFAGPERGCGGDGWFPSRKGMLKYQEGDAPRPGGISMRERWRSRWEMDGGVRGGEQEVYEGAGGGSNQVPEPVESCTVD